MTDSLRDRIANVIFLNVPADPIINSVECYGMADAVIAALKRHAEKGIVWITE